MRKNFFKKIVTAVVTAAMAVGMVAVPNMDAVAAESVYLYGFFNWDTPAVLTSTDGVTFKGEVDLAGEGNMCILNAEGAWDNCASISDLNGNPSWSEGAEQWAHDVVWIGAADDKAGTYTITWNKNTTAMTAVLKTVSTVNWTYEYYVAGEAGLEAELWSNSDPSSYGAKGKMTANGTTWTYTATTTEAFDGTAGYNIIKIGTPDDGGNKNIAWLKDGDAAFACAHSGAGTLTITFDETAGTSTATFVAAGGDNTNTGTNTDTNSGANTNTNNTTTTPDTGDSSMVALYLAVAALAVVVVLKKQTVNN